MARPIRLVCIDDNRLVAEALARRVDLEPDFTWVAWLSGAEGSLAELASLTPDIVLLDIDLPGVDAFELVTAIGQRLPDAKVVMFTGLDRPDYLERALQRGAWGYISKDASTTTLLESLRRVNRGEVALDHEGP